MRSLAIASALTGLTGLVHCATPPHPEPKGGPRGLRASDHLDAARQQDDMARERVYWPELRRPPPESPQVRVMPWYPPGDTAGDHERLADTHRAKADEIYVEYQEACRGVPASSARISPLWVHGIGGANTATGVTVYLSPDAGPPDRLLARIRCHRAALMLGPPAGLAASPLDLPDLEIDARVEQGFITVSIVARDPALVPELQRRAAEGLEAAAARRSRR